MMQLLTANDLKFVPVVSYGRSGSTLMMNLLSHLGAAVAGPLPFEDRSLQTVFLHDLVRQAGGREADPAQAKVHLVRAFGVTYHSRIGAGSADAAELTAKVSAYAVECRDAGKFAIAEKMIGFQVLKQMKTFDNLVNPTIRPVFLIRDPRDILISIKKFNEKRGFKDFNDQENDGRLLKIIIEFLRQQLKLASVYGGFVYYYEDLVARRDRSMLELMNYLNLKTITPMHLQAAWEAVDAGLGEARVHMTSDSAGQSVNRWSAAADPAHRVIFATEAAAIRQLGYAA